MKNAIRAGWTAFGLIPGVAVMLSGLWTPPNMKWLFGAVVEALGALTILLLTVHKTRIERYTPRRITFLTIGMGAAFLLFLVTYLQVLDRCLVVHPTHGSVYYPLWSSGHLAEIVTRAGGRYQAVDHYGSYPVNKAVHEAPDYPWPLVATTALLLFFYQGIFTALALAFGVVGTWTEKNVRTRKLAKKSRST